jgi:hypothetical protein
MTFRDRKILHRCGVRVLHADVDGFGWVNLDLKPLQGNDFGPAYECFMGDWHPVDSRDNHQRGYPIHRIHRCPTSEGEL